MPINQGWSSFSVRGSVNHRIDSGVTVNKEFQEVTVKSKHVVTNSNPSNTDLGFL